jgi:ATP-dependent exoDNAse (exonuclease V) alpha subunit
MSQLQDILGKLNHHNIFLTGGAGVGKSYITNQIIEEYRDKSRGVVALGSTGVSAVNIGGFTVHSFFVFGIANNFDELSIGDKRAKKRLSDLKKILKATDLIIIDEISMISTNLLDMIAYRLSSLGYLGKLLFVGDFFQLPPVQKHQKKGDLFREMLYAFESSAWEKFELEVVELTQMKRTQDVEFTKILQKIRQGLCDAQVVEYMTSLHSNSSVDTIEPTYLFGRNLEVEQTNRMKLDQLDSDETIIFANIDIFGTISEQRVSNWKKMLPISEQLTLKEGVPILFTVNKWGKFVNGERGILRTIEDEYLIVEKSDEFVRVERHEFDLLDMIVKPDGTVETISLATLSQFPLKLAYAVTIHKSQGMSIDKLICNVDNIFAPSQFYVAISRAVDPKTLKIEFTRGDLSRYLQRVINVDDRVVEYYRRL